MEEKTQVEVMLYPEIAEELTKLGIDDQNITVARQNPKRERDIPWEEVEELRKRNQEKLKEIMSKIGWPSVSKVGEVASHAAWLIAQHSDHDPDFQEQALQAMQKAFDEHDIDPTRYAFLVDRVAVNTGQPQRYGTQWTQDENGNHLLQDVENAEELDTRREEIGLIPLSIINGVREGTFPMEEYEKYMRKIGPFTTVNG